MTLAELNAADRAGFVATLGGVVEDSPWVAERACERRPFASIDALHESMVEALTSAGGEAQLAVLCAHPDLGARARMSDASAGEQAGAGLNQLTAAEFDRLGELNRQYRETFGFPFLFAVKGATKQDVLAALERRLRSTPEEEFGEALRQVARIARFRLDSLIRT
jgi:2-oxo-4-hydroxy-4-carboxy-5-ureidoimidazoline decarboxylase